MMMHPSSSQNASLELSWNFLPRWMALVLCTQMMSLAAFTPKKLKKIRSLTFMVSLLVANKDMADYYLLSIENINVCSVVEF